MNGLDNREAVVYAALKDYADEMADNLYEAASALSSAMNAKEFLEREAAKEGVYLCIKNMPLAMELMTIETLYSKTVAELQNRAAKVREYAKEFGK